MIISLVYTYYYCITSYAFILLLCTALNCTLNAFLWVELWLALHACINNNNHNIVQSIIKYWIYFT